MCNVHRIKLSKIFVKGITQPHVEKMSVFLIPRRVKQFVIFGQPVFIAQLNLLAPLGSLSRRFVVFISISFFRPFQIQTIQTHSPQSTLFGSFPITLILHWKIRQMDHTFQNLKIQHICSSSFAEFPENLKNCCKWWTRVSK